MTDKRNSQDARAGRSPGQMGQVLDVVAELCREGRYVEAHDLLESAIPESGLYLPTGGNLRFRSYYGLTLAMALGELSHGAKLCHEAVHTAPDNPELVHNLGMVYLRCRRRDLAVKTFARVLAQFPHYPATNEVMQKLGMRRRPLFASLPRSHPLNRVPGKLLHWVEQTLHARQQPGRTRSAF